MLQAVRIKLFSAHDGLDSFIVVWKLVTICFACKSRFCHGGGKKYADDWAY